jgi:energy-coupling factor transport system ATP-binding protein
MSAPTGTTTPASATGDARLLLEARDVHVRYGGGLPGEHHALRGVTLGVRAGDRVGVMGGSGAGKSTLLHVFARLQAPSAGELWTHDRQAQLPSLVFQFPERQLFAETVREDVGYGLRPSGVPQTEVDARVQEALADVGLPPETFAVRAPFHLSAGEQRRVALAAAIAQRREILLLDEPTLGLDPEGTGRLIRILERMHERGVAIWVASHDADLVATTCTQVVVLDTGRVAFQGATDDLWRDPERAAACGVRLPRESALADRLRACGVAGLPPRPSPEQIAATLLGMWHHRR